MLKTSALTEVALEEAVFELLKRRGPLCSSQIAVELGVPLREIDKALKDLQARGVIEPRPDRDKTVHYDKTEIPWGLVRPKLFARRH